MAIAQSAEALIGNTPLLKLNRLFPDMDIYAKLEYLNPAGSAKDRAARSMLNDLETRGLLKAGGVRGGADLGQYGRGAGGAVRGARLPADPHHAGNHERRAPHAAFRLLGRNWCSPRGRKEWPAR